MLDNGEPDDALTKYLRNDDIDSFQSAISLYQIKISETNVPFNIFDDFSKPLNLINYAALYGSIRCFKYLLLNHEKVDLETFYFAVYGGNIEIIKIVDQHCSSTNEIPMFDDYRNSTNIGNYNSIIQIAIKMHRNELFDWIYEQKFISKGKIGNDLIDAALVSASNGNAHSLFEIIERGLDSDEISYETLISKASKNGFYDLTKLLLELVDESKIKKLHFNFNILVQFGNLSIFKLLFQYMNQSDLEKSIFYAIKMEYDKIIRYYFNNIVDKSSICENDFTSFSLILSMRHKTNDCFFYLFEIILKLCSNNFTLRFLELLLVKSCLFGNLTVFISMAKLILKLNDKYDFSTAFIKAASSNSLSICKYISEKKLILDYYKIFINSYELGFLDKDLFSNILKSANSNLKEKFLHCIYYAIQKKNRNLVEYLLSENAPYSNALLKAASINDFEMVNLILKYHNEPSFINKNSKEGTAFLIAVKNNNADIVKLLLSIPGINPHLYNKCNEYPLSVAIKNFNLEIINEILKFYDDDIQSDTDELNQVMISLLELFNSKQFLSNNKGREIIKRFFKIKSFDINFGSNYTFLFYSCHYNEIELVELLLAFDRIDVNKYTNYGDTPLIIAVKENYINLAKMLINYPKTNINFMNFDKDIALIFAVKNEQVEIIDLLINDERFDPDESRLDYAFYLSNDEIAKQLIMHKSLDVNFSCEEPKELKFEFDFFLGSFEMKNNSLFQAVTNNSIEKIDLIIKHPSFDYNKSQLIGAINIAMKNKNIPILNKLLGVIQKDNFMDISIINESFLFYKSIDTLPEIAVHYSNIDIIKMIFNHPYFDPNSKLIIKSFVKSYIYHEDNDNQANENTTIKKMNFILDFDKKHANLIEFNKLLENGRSFFTVIKDDYEELGKVSDFLLDHGVDPNAPDRYNCYPLEKAIDLQSLNLFNSLINSNKINFNQKIYGETYLHIAARKKDSIFMKILLDLNVIDINSIDNKGRTPLFIACQNKNVDCVNLLFEKDDLDYLHPDNEGKDVLKTIANLYEKKYNHAIKSKENYRKKIVSILKNRYDDDSSESDGQNAFYDYDDIVDNEYNENSKEYSSEEEYENESSSENDDDNDIYNNSRFDLW